MNKHDGLAENITLTYNTEELSDEFVNEYLEGDESNAPRTVWDFDVYLFGFTDDDLKIECKAVYNDESVLKSVTTLGDVAEFLSGLEDVHKDHDEDFIMEYYFYDLERLPVDVEPSDVHSQMSDYDFGVMSFETHGEEGVSDFIMQYFDYEAYGRDMKANYSETDNYIYM